MNAGITTQYSTRGVQTMPFIDAADGTRLFYKDWGAGPPVVFVHAWSLSSAMWETQVAGFRTIFDTDLRVDLARVEIPTLVVHGDADASAPIDLTGRRTAALLPDSRFETYAGAGHGLYVSDADRLAKDLLAFVGQAA